MMMMKKAQGILKKTIIAASILIGCICLTTNAFAGSLVWYTSKAEAVSKATSEGKKILLVATYTDGYKTTAMNTLFESTSPPIHCLLEQKVILWYCDYLSSKEYVPYFSGINSYYPPVIVFIDPNDGDHFLDRITTGVPTPDVFYSKLKYIAGSDCLTVAISGYVKDSNGIGIAEAMINFSNGGGLEKTSSDGYYTHNVPLAWSGTITSYKVGYTFSPNNRSLNNITSPQSGQDFVGNIINDPYVLEIYQTGRIASLLMPQTEYDGYHNGNPDWGNITKYLYTQFKDDFDFIFMISNNKDVPSGLYYGYYDPVRNDVQGIGNYLYDFTSYYGSSGKLRGVMHIPYRSGMENGPTLHELMHAWGNYIVKTSYASHWGFSSAGGQLGGFKDSTLVNLGGGVYQANNGKTGSTSFGENANGGNSLPYSDIELYLMGLIDKTQIQPLQIAVNPTWVDRNTGKFSADGFTTYTIDDIIQKNGQRIPSVTDSQKKFKSLAVVITPQPLSETEWKEVDDDVNFFSFASNDGNYLYNFWEATRGIADITMDNIIKSSLKPFTQTITFPAITSKTYGAADFDLGAKASSGLAVIYTSSNTAAATIVSGKIHIVGAGTSIITASQGGDANWQAASNVQQTLTVNKAILIITADNKNRAYNTPNPALTYTPSGFVNDDTSSVLSVSPNLTTSAVITSPQGSYPITLGAGTCTAENYSFSFVNGTLTVGINTIVMGDINGDKAVDLKDAILALQVLIGAIQPEILSNYSSSGVDVNGNGRIDPAEVIYILQKAAGAR